MHDDVHTLKNIVKIYYTNIVFLKLLIYVLHLLQPQQNGHVLGIVFSSKEHLI